jgi:hypothetical protein
MFSHMEILFIGLCRSYRLLALVGLGCVLNDKVCCLHTELCYFRTRSNKHYSETWGSVNVRKFYTKF